jgi:hypothetical protein
VEIGDSIHYFSATEIVGLNQGMRGISHCMVMIGSKGTILMKMMYIIINLVVFILMITGFIFT